MRSPEEILREARTIAVVGASARPTRPSHGVMRYLLAHVDEPIDLVDVFRRPEHVPAHAREAVAAGARAFWLQLGLRSPEAREIAVAGGLDYVEDACTAVVHSAMRRRA